MTLRERSIDDRLCAAEQVLYYYHQRGLIGGFAIIYPDPEHDPDGGVSVDVTDLPASLHLLFISELHYALYGFF